MIKTITINNNITIVNPNFSRDPAGVIRETVAEKYNNKLISNYIVTDAQVKHIGMVRPSLEKHIIATAAVSIECKILFVPDNCVIPRCKFIGMVSENSDQAIYQFEPDLPNASRISIFVANNGLSAAEIKQLENLEVGDVTSLFIVTTVAYYNTDKLGCIALPNFDGAKSPLFTFGAAHAKEFEGVEAGKTYMLQNKKLVEAKTDQKGIDFLSVDELKNYINDLNQLG